MNADSPHMGVNFARRITHNRASILSRLGETFGEPKNLRAAITCFEEALTAMVGDEGRAETLNGLAIARQRLGEILRDQQILQRAVDDHDEQKRLLKRLASPSRAVARVWNNRGVALQELGEVTGESGYLRRSVASFDKALEIYDRRRDPLDWAMTQLNRGGALLGQGEVQRSRKRLQQALGCFSLALTVYRRNRAPLNYGKAMHNRGRALLSLATKTGDSRHLPTALRSFKAALTVFEHDGSIDQRQDTAAYVAQTLMRLQRYSDAEILLGEILSRSGTTLRSAAHSAESRDHAIDQVGELHALLSLCRLRLRPKDALDALRAAEEGRERLLREAERLSSRSDASPRRRTPLSTAQLQELVPPGGALVIPVVTTVAGFVFVITERDGVVALKHGFPSFNLGAARVQIRSWEKVYQETIGSGGFRLRSKNANSPYRRWNDEIGRVMRWVWESFVERIDGHLREVARLSPGARIVLLPPSPLNILPLHGAGPSDAPNLGSRWTISFAPSLNTLHQCRMRAATLRQAPAKLLAVIDPTTRLNNALAEGQFFDEYYRGINPIVLRRGEAHLAEVSSLLSTTTHVHISTHGKHDPDAPRNSFIQLADGPATISDLCRGRLSEARLVYLASCESGLAGVRRMEEEYIGMPSGFLQAGAACVIASLWPVFDDAAYLLSRGFYERYLGGDGRILAAPEVALRDAQAWLRALPRIEAAKLLLLTDSSVTGLSLSTLTLFPSPVHASVRGRRQSSAGRHLMG